MLTECKCGNPVEAKLDTETNKVICQNCKQEIDNISQFAKDRMRADGDIVRTNVNVIPVGGMQVECNNCHKTIVALLDKRDNNCYCSLCKKEVNLSSYAVALLRENGQYVGIVSQDNFVGDDLDISGEVTTEQVVQFDENGRLEVIKLGSEVEPVSPVELLAKRNKAIADELKKVTSTPSASSKTEIEVKSNSLTTSMISLMPDDELKRLVTSTNPDDIALRQQIDPQVLAYVYAGKNIPLTETPVVEAPVVKRKRGRPPKGDSQKA